VSGAGTGKTRNASTILLSLSVIEKEKIMVCAAMNLPSNEAADCIAESIAKLNVRFCLGAVYFVCSQGVGKNKY
jgi:hypothetical protein